MYNTVLPEGRGYIPMFVGRYLEEDEEGVFSYKTQLGSLDPFVNEEVRRRLCVWTLRQEVRVNVAQLSTADDSLGDHKLLGEEWNEHLLQTVRCLTQKHRAVEVLGVESVPTDVDMTGVVPSQTGLSVHEVQQFVTRNKISGLDALKRICDGTGVQSITCMDVGTRSAEDAVNLQDIVRVCCDELRVPNLTILEYRGRDNLYSQVTSLISVYPHYTFSRGYWNGRVVYGMKVTV